MCKQPCTPRRGHEDNPEFRLPQQETELRVVLVATEACALPDVGQGTPRRGHEDDPEFRLLLDRLIDPSPPRGGGDRRARSTNHEKGDHEKEDHEHEPVPRNHDFWA